MSNQVHSPFLYAEGHPEHSRTSCSDVVPCNADPVGSHGCARCTALKLDRAARMSQLIAELRILLVQINEDIDGDHYANLSASALDLIDAEQEHHQ